MSIQDGRIIERGNHDELVKAEGLYFNMVKQQVFNKNIKILDITYWCL